MVFVPKPEIVLRFKEEKDDYEATFGIGQRAADLAAGARNPNETFRRIHALGVAAVRESQPQSSRPFPWAT